MKSVTKLLQGIVLIAGLASANSAFAQELPAFAPGADEVMSLDELSAYVGGASSHDSVVITEETLQALNHDNVVVGDIVKSGDITLANGGLSGFDGIGNFIMNTGHQNNLQSSMSVSILLGPAS